jgi:CTP:molybdopterin cytidylyltransferase MocA
MGGPKLFRHHAGRTFVERILSRCAESASPVVLVVDPRFLERAEQMLAAASAKGTTLAEADGTLPMLASIQAGLRAATLPPGPPWNGGFWLWPVDAPFLSAKGWKRARDTVQGDPDSIWKLRVAGKTGHPIWLPGWSVPRILAGTWPNGLLGFLAGCGERVRILPLEGEVIGDFNTPESLAHLPETL